MYPLYIYVAIVLHVFPSMPLSSPHPALPVCRAYCALRFGRLPRQWVSGARRAYGEQPVKSIRAGVTVVPGAASKGFMLVSLSVVCDEGMQDGVPPLIGTNASARMVNGTLPIAGAE
jgi:hypothetical protein